MRLKPQALPLHAALGACADSGKPQGTGRYEVDEAGSKGDADDVGQPAQPAQGIHAASLLVSTARSSCCGGVPRRTRTTYVGVCSSCRPDAMHHACTCMRVRGVHPDPEVSRRLKNRNKGV